jgi:AmmeMemoRadiSam system protein B
MDFPRFRTDIDAIPTLYQEERVLIIKDSLGLIKKPVLLSKTDLEFAQLLDGSRTVQDIQLHLMRQKGGLLVSSDSIQKMIHDFDSLFLLDSERYRQAKSRMIEDFSKQDTRRPYLAGSAYPDSDEELRGYLDSILSRNNQEEVSPAGPVRALIAPHIDLEVGRRIYGLAYRTLRRMSPKRIVLMGTGHGLTDGFVSLTTKDFETPLGLVRTDRKAVLRLKKDAGEVLASSDFAHRSEHSIEFQTLFLRHLFGDTFVLVPLLFGSFHDVLHTHARPSLIPGMGEFLNVLHALLDESPSETLCVAGVDLSHIGPKFGHAYPSSALIQDARAHDARLIEKICSGDVEGFWAESQNDGPSYNVCGFSALACLLEVLPDNEGFLLGYDFWEEESTQSAVSFAAITLGVKK